VEVEKSVIQSMQSSPFNFEDTRWAAYQNKAMDSASAGNVIYLAIGPQNTFKTRPEHAPDGPHGMGWKYLPIGWVNMEEGRIEEDNGKSSAPTETTE
jgi:hypothetical protein